jgi:hypothetical protein
LKADAACSGPESERGERRSLMPSDDHRVGQPARSARRRPRGAHWRPAPSELFRRVPHEVRRDH